MEDPWEFYLGGALTAMALAAAVFYAWAYKALKQRVAQLEAEALARQAELEVSTTQSGDLRRAHGELESALRREIDRRSAAEELGKRVPILDSELAAARLRCDRLLATETEIRERVARVEADLAAAQSRVADREVTVRQVTAERDAAQSECTQQREDVARLRERIGGLESDLSAKNERAGHLESEGAQISAERDQLRSDLESARRALAEKTIELQSAQATAIEKGTFLQSAREQLSDSFKALAGEMLQKNSKEFSNVSQEALGMLLNPLKERIAEFDSKVTTVYDKESRERVSLQQEIRMLSELHSRMSQQTENLTRALKGSGKTQGTWGELVLETLLAGSGLRQGEEYVVQQSLLDEDGHRLQPDNDADRALALDLAND